MRPYLENTQHKTAGRVAQEVEHLSSKCEALNTNPSAANNNNSDNVQLYSSGKDS
jgi:hypothetical protein